VGVFSPSGGHSAIIPIVQVTIRGLSAIIRAPSGGMRAACSKHEQTLLVEGQMPKQVPDFDLPSPSSESESHESASEQEYDDDGSQRPSPSQYQDQKLKEMADQDV
jgi:hypothetical protein